ncbi:unnamed protein product [Alternaria alternata]
MSWMRYLSYIDSQQERDDLYKLWNSTKGKAPQDALERVDGTFSWPIVPRCPFPQRHPYPRRTLDQFYYPALNDTSARDKDQTISKWTGKLLTGDGKVEAGASSIMIMVDQFWCWIIDENTIITSFPSGSYSLSLGGVQDLYWSITKSLSHAPEQLKNVEDIYLLLVKEATSYMFSQVNRSSVDMVEIYRWVAGKKAATQTTYFQKFQRGYASGGDNNSIFNDRGDLKLLLEVADIIDELKMIQHLLNVQKDVIGSSIKALKTPTLTRPGQLTISYKIEDTIKPLLAQFNSVKNDAEHTRKMLLHLSDLKSKAASLEEAHASVEAAQFSAKEAQAASTQGRAVMLFTIVTVIFLPLSFFTSYFGQNVKELTGDENNRSAWQLWLVATPITVVVIVVALLIAYYITRPWSELWFWKDQAEAGAPAEAESSAASEIVSVGTKHEKWWKRNPFSFLRVLAFWKRNKTNEKGVEKNETGLEGKEVGVVEPRVEGQREPTPEEPRQEGPTPEGTTQEGTTQEGSKVEGPTLERDRFQFRRVKTTQEKTMFKSRRVKTT